VNRMTVARPLIIAAVILGGWEAFVHLTGQPRFILPAPSVVAGQIAERFDVLAGHFAVTAAEILVGLLCGTLLGAGAALTLAFFRGARQWLLPPLVVSQAVPVFALAPVLTLWVGYGVVSKIAMATLIIFFPVTAAFFDGLRRTEPGWLDQARVMGASRWRTLRHLQLPAALPAFASGMRVAAAFAPIGAIVGEWVGASSGLGYLMLHANGRGQTDVMFAALVLLAAFSVALYFTVDHLLRRMLPWQPDQWAGGRLSAPELDRPVP
jgi:putative hydroxymethylpyrimidine transport system permease protein